MRWNCWSEGGFLLSLPLARVTISLEGKTRDIKLPPHFSDVCVVSN
jgi:hypothetical protein